MLIVNADDFGAAASASDAILETIDAGAVSSLSAMVWMPDSDRAAMLARERGLALGLHLNLTLPFAGPGVPVAAAERQLRLTERFRKDSWWRNEVGGVDPVDVQDAVNDQLEQFRATFGEPAHINGHHHVHVTDVVLDALPAAIPIRQVPTTPAEIGARNRRAERIRARFLTPHATLDLSAVHPALGGHPLEALGEMVERGPIEVVVHPQLADQRAVLLEAEWRDTIEAIGLGDFGDLDQLGA